MDSDRARELLAGERKRIEEAIASARRDEPEEADSRVEPGDRGSENLMQDELDAGLNEGHEQQLAALERAEERLAAGTYGRSVDSGESIPDQRLEAHPTAERTVEEEGRPPK